MSFAVVTNGHEQTIPMFFDMRREEEFERSKNFHFEYLGHYLPFHTLIVTLFSTDRYTALQNAPLDSLKFPVYAIRKRDLHTTTDQYCSSSWQTFGLSPYTKFLVAG